MIEERSAHTRAQLISNFILSLECIFYIHVQLNTWKLMRLWYCYTKYILYAYRRILLEDVHVISMLCHMHVINPHCPNIYFTNIIIYDETWCLDNNRKLWFVLSKQIDMMPEKLRNT